MDKRISQLVLSYFPITAAFRESLETALGQVDSYHPVGRIRNLGLRGLWSYMRGLRGDRLIIAIENDQNRPLLGPLRLLAAASRIRQITVVWPNMTLEVMPWWKILPMVWRLWAEQLRSRRGFRNVQLQIGKPAFRLLPAPKVIPQRGHGVFLDANLSFGLSAGGALGHIKGVMDGLITQGFTMDYVSTKPMPTDIQGAFHVKVPAPHLLAFPAEMNYYAFHRDFDQAAQQAIRERPADFIYQRMSLHNISGVDLSRSAGVPLVVEYNGSEAWAAANWGHKLYLHDAAILAERHILQAADLVVTVSAPLLNELVAMGIPPERVVMYPNCIDPNIFSPERFNDSHRNSLRQKLGIASDSCVATFIGTFGAWHGVDFLAWAIRRLIDEQPDFLNHHKLHFLLVGDGLKKPEVMKALGDVPYSRYVSLPGLVPQHLAPEYLAISNIFLSPHMPNPDGAPFFGSPTKLFEYMAMERPILASDLDQIGIILRGEFGGSASSPRLASLYPPGDETAMLDTLRWIVTNPHTAQHMAERARKNVLNNYTWDHHVGKILERMQILGFLSGSDHEKE